MGRPTIALSVILKNEIENLPRFYESVKGCFDEIHFTDTGSTDGSQAWIEKKQLEDPALRLHAFEWVNDFAAARNYSFSFAKTDYLMWMDLDDVLSDKEAFKSWRDSVMHIAGYWLSTYNYSYDGKKPVCSFSRERVVKNDDSFHWRYFIHEGIVPKSTAIPIQANYATTWTVNHQRSEDDLKKDRSRNLTIFKTHKEKLDARMTYYYGKELFENREPLEGYEKLIEAAGLPDLELHDRIMAIQYAALCCQQLNQLEKAIALSFQGLQLAPGRAEFFVLIGDSYTKQNRLSEALPFYEAACHCQRPTPNALHAGAIFRHEDSYGFYPRLQLSRLYVHLGELERARGCVSAAEAIQVTAESEALKVEIDKLQKSVTVPKKGQGKKTDEIIFLCPPQGLYEWDNEIARERGVGGSEIACIQMATRLQEKTGLKVKVFNNRQTAKAFRTDKGEVEYLPAAQANEYLSKQEPKVCINWRHTMRLTPAPTYVWLHDLMAPGLENHENYDGVLCLSEFHINYVTQLHGVPQNKVILTRNGIDPQRFEQKPSSELLKLPYVVFSSSPDRGLDRALFVMDEVIRKVPLAQFHVYYGFDNMMKLGHIEAVKKLKGMLSERPYVHFHGNLEQKVLSEELKKASVWLYPTNFLETYCITALEMLASKVYPVVRKWGGLAETLDCFAPHASDVIDSDCVSPAEVSLYADRVIQALTKEKWRDVDVDPKGMSWESVAGAWLEWLPL